jgi:hypothetical protein
VNAMKSHRSIPSLRSAAVGAVSAAVLACGALSIAEPATAHSAKQPMPGNEMSSITIKATPTTITSGGTVVFTGRTEGLRAGTKLILQEKLKGKWIPLSATSISTGHSYILKGVLKTKGKQQLRVVQTDTVSPRTTVTVR